MENTTLFSRKKMMILHILAALVIIAGIIKEVFSTNVDTGWIILFIMSLWVIFYHYKNSLKNIESKES